MIMVVVVVVVTPIVQVMAQLSQELSELRQLHATHASHAGPLQPQRTSHREDEWDSCGFNRGYHCYVFKFKRLERDFRRVYLEPQ